MHPVGNIYILLPLLPCSKLTENKPEHQEKSEQNNKNKLKLDSTRTNKRKVAINIIVSAVSLLHVLPPCIAILAERTSRARIILALSRCIDASSGGRERESTIQGDTLTLSLTLTHTIFLQIFFSPYANGSGLVWFPTLGPWRCIAKIKCAR